MPQAHTRGSGPGRSRGCTILLAHCSACRGIFVSRGFYLENACFIRRHQRLATNSRYNYGNGYCSSQLELFESRHQRASATSKGKIAISFKRICTGLINSFVVQILSVNFSTDPLSRFISAERNITHMESIVIF